MGKRRKKSRLKRIVFFSLVLLALYILLYFMTPSVSSYYYEKESDKEIAGLENAYAHQRGDTHSSYRLFSCL